MSPPLDKEFDDFPPAIKRKYFSTLERLRIAQETVFSITCASAQPDGKVNAPKRNLLPCLNRNAIHSGTPWIRRAEKPPASTVDYFSRADAQWFMRLPDKVQKTQFTREEQLLLAGHYDAVIPDAADEVFYRLGHQRNQSVPSLQSPTLSSRSSLSSLEFDCFSNSDSDMEDSTMDGFRWLDDDDDLDLSLDDYHTHIISITEPSKNPSSRRPSFRRSLSLTNLPFGSTKPLSANKSLVPPNPMPPPLATLHNQISPSRPQQIRSKPSQNIPTPRSFLQRPRPPIKSPAQHYQDPEARLKLRVYLASPQKFDEAIEFGFPSLQNQEIYLPPIKTRPPLPKTHHTEPTLLTWFHDDEPSIFDALGSDSDATTLPERPHSPAFRDPHCHHYHSSPLRGSNPTECSVPFLRPYHPPAIPYAHILSGTREMTLRMTLTRPDLRKDKDQQSDVLYNGQSDDDPLALEQLPSLASGGGIWDSLPVRDGVVRKLWQRVSRRGG